MKYNEKLYYTIKQLTDFCFRTLIIVKICIYMIIGTPKVTQAATTFFIVSNNKMKVFSLFSSVVRIP